MTLEDHPVEHRQAPGDPIAMHILEAVHRSPPRRYCDAKSSPRDARAQGRLRRPDNHPVHCRTRPLVAAERSAASEAALGDTIEIAPDRAPGFGEAGSGWVRSGRRLETVLAV